jgi:hypothetical protein
MPLTFDAVHAFASSLPGVAVGTRGGGRRTWMVNEKGFAWERAFSKADLERFGDETPPAGPILAVRVENLEAKEALLDAGMPGFFTIPHFNGYAAVLIALRKARAQDVRAAIAHGFRAVSPPEAPVRPRGSGRKRAAKRPAARRR